MIPNEALFTPTTFSADYEALDAQWFLPQAVGQHDDIRAEFESLTAANCACQALHDAGIPDACVHLLGQRGDEVSTAWGLSADEQLEFGTVGRFAAVGGGLGLVTGGAQGLIIGLPLLGAGEGLWAAITGMAVLFAGIGAFTGGISAIETVARRSALHRRFPFLDHAIIGIEATGPGEIEWVEAVLREQRPMRLERRPTPLGA